MRRVSALSLIVLLTIARASAAGPPTTVEKTTIELESVAQKIEAELFEIGFLLGDSNYHSIAAASDGKIYFTVDTHDSDYAARFYAFDPATETMTLVGKMDEALGEDASKQIPQGKIHTPLYEHKGKLWFSTHTAFYDGELPARDSGAKSEHSGGHFMSYDLKTGQFEDLAHVFPNEGIITMLMDKEHEMLYGLTWPSGLLVSYDIGKKALRCWGAVQGRGEWGHHPEEWDRICRSLALDPTGVLYGSTMDGAIWKFERENPRPVTYIEGLDLARLEAAQSVDSTLEGDFQHNWRAIEWNAQTGSFWGIVWESATLFEFIPEKGYLRAVTELRPEAYQHMPRHPDIAQLGFALAPNNTVFYLGHGPAVTIEGRPEVQSAVHLLTYDIGQDDLSDHGPVLSADGRRVFYTESLAFGPDDYVYTVAWVEVIDPAHAAEIRTARKFGPAETEKMTYELMLVRLPKWQTFSAAGGR